MMGGGGGEGGAERNGVNFCFGQFDKAYDISMIDELLNILWGID